MKNPYLKKFIKEIIEEEVSQQEIFALFKKIDPNSSLQGAPFGDSARNFAWIIITKYGKTPEDAVRAIEEYWRQERQVAEKMVADVMQKIQPHES